MMRSLAVLTFSLALLVACATVSDDPPLAGEAFDLGVGSYALGALAGNGKCLDVAEGGTSDGTSIREWICNGSGAQLFQPQAGARDVTFFVVSDTHADPPQSYDLRAMARAINAVAQDGSWPATIGGQATGFAGAKIGAPAGVVFTGDLMAGASRPPSS